MLDPKSDTWNKHIADVVFKLKKTPSDEGAKWLNAYYSIGETTHIINDPEMDTTKVASIFDSPNLTPANGALIINNEQISASKASDILQHSNLGADRMQDILYHANLSHEKRVKILTDAASDVTYSANTTITGVVRRKAVTIDSAVTLTHDGQPGILICGSLTNNGTYTKSLTGGAGGAAGGTTGDGGQGGGGLIVFLNTLDNNSTIQANGENGEDGSTTASEAAYDGSDGEGNTDLLLVSGDSAGDGGGVTDCQDDQFFGNTRLGGLGGWQNGYQGGDGGARNTTVHDDAVALADHIMKYCVDWWIQNVAGKSPTSTEPQPDPNGAGGGGGSDAFLNSDGGGGGGSGGQVIIKANDFDNTGTISADGGAGGDGGSEGGQDCGGGGGPGSIIYGLYQTFTNEGTLSASGGAGGTSDCADAEDGTAGTAKTYNA